MVADLQGERLHSQAGSFTTACSDVAWLLVITLVELEINGEELLLLCFGLSM